MKIQPYTRTNADTKASSTESYIPNNDNFQGNSKNLNLFDKVLPLLGYLDTFSKLFNKKQDNKTEKIKDNKSSELFDENSSELLKNYKGNDERSEQPNEPQGQNPQFDFSNLFNKIKNNDKNKEHKTMENNNNNNNNSFFGNLMSNIFPNNNAVNENSAQEDQVNNDEKYQKVNSLSCTACNGGKEKSEMPAWQKEYSTKKYWKSFENHQSTIQRLNGTKIKYKTPNQNDK